MKNPPPFLGEVEPPLPLEQARFVVLPVPYEATTSYAHGTAKGPAAILQASAQVELYDEETKAEPYRAGIATVEPLNFTDSTASEAMKTIEEATARICSRGQIPLLLGGEHSITPPAVKGVHEHHNDFTVVQLDAHADLRLSYEGTSYSHACALAGVRKQGVPAVQIGIRSLSEPEARWIERDRLPVFFAHELDDAEWMQRALSAVKTKKIYLTLDVDAFDSSMMPDTGTPEPGGMTWRQVTQFLQLLFQHKELVGMDVVELLPKEGSHASDFLVARLISKSIAYWQRAERAKGKKVY